MVKSKLKLIRPVWEAYIQFPYQRQQEPTDKTLTWSRNEKIYFWTGLSGLKTGFPVRRWRSPNLSHFPAQLIWLSINIQDKFPSKELSVIKIDLHEIFKTLPMIFLSLRRGKLISRCCPSVCLSVCLSSIFYFFKKRGFKNNILSYSQNLSFWKIRKKRTDRLTDRQTDRRTGPTY